MSKGSVRQVEVYAEVPINIIAEPQAAGEKKNSMMVLVMDSRKCISSTDYRQDLIPGTFMLFNYIFLLEARVQVQNSGVRIWTAGRQLSGSERYYEGYNRNMTMVMISTYNCCYYYYQSLYYYH